MPKENNNNNGQDRRSRRHDPLGRAPERTVKRGESPQRVSRPSETRSSTPRGGRPGQRGRGGYPNVGVRGGHGGHSSSRPSSSMYWNQPQPESETMYKYSAMAWMTRVYRGRSARHQAHSFGTC
ncbi:uncharacterized protein LW93_5139 [Fusarium fujikuroi]|nr:uncharacterized protein LW93_5139 [Fusarium fujikuroi]